MLVLSRHKNEEIVIAGNIRVRVLSIDGDRVRIGIETDDGTPITRSEEERMVAGEPPNLVPLTEIDDANFAQLCGAVKKECATIMSAVRRSTGKPVVLICALNRKPGGGVEFVPFAELLSGDEPACAFAMPEGLECASEVPYPHNAGSAEPK